MNNKNINFCKINICDRFEEPTDIVVNFVVESYVDCSIKNLETF